MSIIKTTITLTILHDEDDYPDYGAADMDIEDVLHEMDCGDMIGVFSVSKVEEVHPDNVEAELKALGNDGTFFDVE